MGVQNREEWNKAYRLTLTEDRSHKRIRAYRFSKLSLLIAAITVAVVLIGGFYLLFAFTPLRTTIPGYPNAHSKRDAVANAIRIDSLESTITRWELYADNLGRVLSGEQTLDLDSIIKGNTTRYLQNKSIEELQRQDSILRETVRQEEQFGVSPEADRVLPINGQHFFPPVKGVISQGYDKALHPGIDVTAPANSVVSAVLDGTVVFAGWDDANGYSLVIQHAGDILSTYKHNQKLLKAAGDKVTAGTPIALVGSTGSLTTGEHLHFELWYQGEAVDPATYISF
ncbi:MAG: M23 family metallopeptidase [Bacteroidales bacterium]|nr:M23 family metallopeptidase [Bacteroidales bacterium]MCR5276652.1 M23 family metallopeptidase [Bacteroidales bacterium]